MDINGNKIYDQKMQIEHRIIKNFEIFFFLIFAERIH